MLPSTWQRPASAPPSPAPTTTTADHSLPRSPFTPYVATTIDGYILYPPSPYCDPYGKEDELEAPDAEDFDSATEPTPSGQPDVSQSGVSTTPVDLSMNDMLMHDYHARPLVSGNLTYYPERYAHPSPVLIIMQRATRDKCGNKGCPIDTLTCDQPSKLFSLTGGHVPMTGLSGHDEQTPQYYVKRPFPYRFGQFEDSVSFHYPIDVIDSVRQSLRRDWFLVYPSPIPVLLIRSHDLIGPQALSRGLDGFAFVAPTKDSIWPIILQRGVDANFRPLDPTVTIETDECSKGAAQYLPQHIVAPKLVMNVFLESASYATGQYPRCEYLGAFVLQLMENTTMHSDIWATIDPEVQWAAYHRILYHANGRPYLPLVRFLFYKWDENILGLADEIFLTRTVALLERIPGSLDELGHRY